MWVTRLQHGRLPNQAYSGLATIRSGLLGLGKAPGEVGDLVSHLNAASAMLAVSPVAPFVEALQDVSHSSPPYEIETKLNELTV